MAPARYRAWSSTNWRKRGARKDRSAWRGKGELDARDFQAYLGTRGSCRCAWWALRRIAAIAADANHGGELARRWCATCHLVDKDQKQASADVAPFAVIAHRSDFTAEKLAFFLLDPHPKMPNFPLSRNEAADIAAYIGSLR